MRVRFIPPDLLPPNREISPTVRRELGQALRSIRTPVWPIVGSVTNGAIKRAPFDVPQGWINNILKYLLIDLGYNDEVSPFSENRPNSLVNRPEGGLEQAIDFERCIRSGNRHVIEVELGNVASLYRSIHKLCLALQENENSTAILIIPSNDLIARCEPASAMSNYESARIVISEFAYYFCEAAFIHIVEFSDNIECNLQNLVDDNHFWRGNFSNEMQEYLRNNINQFLR